jgi:muramoyltetrapeptide carboxypeptidase
VAERTLAFAADTFLDRAPEIVFHPQCFLSSAHLAGDDETRAAAFLEYANDPRFDALWFAKGGYGACRIVEHVMANYHLSARDKLYLGYSDGGAMLAGLYKLGFPNLAHGPMPVDVTREGGAGALKRALSYMLDRAPDALELTCASDVKTAAFNIAVFSDILGTPLEPDLTDHVLMLEDVGEYLYRIDRALFHITSSVNVRRVRGIKLGRVSEVIANVYPFGESEEDMARRWCARSGIPYLGRADIGHDVDNHVVPFGVVQR